MYGVYHDKRQQRAQTMMMDGINRTILVVDDEEVNLKIIVWNLQKEGYAVITAASGEEAWEILARSPTGFDAVLLDRMMPGIDGLEVLRRMKAHEELKNVPVIFQTGMTREEEILEGIQAGAFYYLTKPFRKERLLAVVKSAIEDHSQYKALQNETRRTVDALHLLTRGDFYLKSLEDADNLATLIAKMCPGSEKVVLGLWELLINAVEHGNLGITYEEKSRLLQDNTWRQEIDRRIRMPEYAHKRVHVHFERAQEEISITIEDMGPGFDWRQYMELSPERLFDSHGRGIVLASCYSFDRVEYLGRGNKVRAVLNNSNNAVSQESVPQT